MNIEQLQLTPSLPAVCPAWIRRMVMRKICYTLCIRRVRERRIEIYFDDDCSCVVTVVGFACCCCIIICSPDYGYAPLTFSPSAAATRPFLALHDCVACLFDFIKSKITIFCPPHLSLLRHQRSNERSLSLSLSRSPSALHKKRRRPQEE